MLVVVIAIINIENRMGKLKIKKGRFIAVNEPP